MSNYGSWTVLSKNASKVHYYKCRCVCGTVREVYKYELIKGHTKSCGCRRNANKVKKHAYVGTRTYHSWSGIIQRCHNENHPRYHDYGGRGITVCSEWKEDFINFLHDMGECPSNKHSIERIDNNKGYDKHNCKWATPQEQSRNTRRNVYITHEGITLTRKEWAAKTGLSETAIKYRLKQGWTVGKTLTTPSIQAKARKNRKREHLVTYNGETLSLVQWSRITKINEHTIRYRLLKGWSVKRALTTKVTRKRSVAL